VEADLAEEIVVEVDLAVGAETAVRLLCIRRFATNVKSHAKYPLSQPAASRCIVMIVLEA